MIKQTLKSLLQKLLGPSHYLRCIAEYHFWKNLFPSCFIIWQNRHKPLNQIYPLARPVKLITREPFIYNAHFGLNRNFKNYSSYKGPIKAIIEHSLGFYSRVSAEEINSIFPKIITLSDFRENILKQATSKEIHKIGPYIHYAASYYSKEQFIKEKKRLGKVLLVFPAHSTEACVEQYNPQIFIRYINSLRPQFDTVMVCTFFTDVLRGITEPYLKEGYEVVTAGCRYDPYFLNRLRTIIDLADYTISNNVGTHLGYCISLNKPHYVFSQEVNLYQCDLSGNPSAQIPKSVTQDATNAVNEIKSFFTDWTDTITPAQLNIVDKYWGLSHIKTSEELKEILS